LRYNSFVYKYRGRINNEKTYSFSAHSNLPCRIYDRLRRQQLADRLIGGGIISGGKLIGGGQLNISGLVITGCTEI
jgi:hypothetical protein